MQTSTVESDEAGATRILRPGDNVWRLENATRVGVCIDAADYFAAVDEAARKAEHSILIAGWDIHSKLLLRRGDDGPQVPLGEFLNELVRQRPNLRVNILGWDFALIYALERESLPLLRFGIRTANRIDFRLDGDCPIGSSHHQKIVVVDDSIAFVGGIDLTAYRWDTRDHLAQDPRRVTPAGDVYGPFHDIQMAVEGRAAVAVGDLLRERWKRTTGKELSRPPATGDRWPERLPVLVRDASVGIARTEPAWAGRDEVREVERSYLDMIRAAERTIYIENQYFTAPPIVDALAERLAEPNGPEVVLTVPQKCSGWLEEATMGLLRRRALAKLREADTRGRFRVVYPTVGGDPPVAVNVHAKVMIVDDAVARIGSSNLNNRSLGLDTECDLVLEAQSREHAAAIARFRDDLLAEHLGVDVTDVRRTFEESGSLVDTIEQLRAEEGKERTLADVAEEPPDVVDALLPNTSLLDPEKPIDPRTWIDQLGPEPDDASSTWGAVARIGAIAVPLVALALLWRYGPLQSWLDPEAIEGGLGAYRDDLAAGPVAVLAFVVGGVTMFPVTLLIVASALLFGPTWGFVYSLVGVVASAAVGYWLGSVLWRDAVRKLAGKRLNRLSKRLAKNGLVAVAVVRVVPVAPYTVVNLVAGSSHVGWRDFLLGTVLGMGPGIAAMTLFADRLLDAVRNPDAGTVAVLLAVGALVIAGGAWANRKFGAE